MADRVIFHCDCNGFFASVETLLNPGLAKVPMAVTGDPENRHGIILAKNELAKKYGVQTAETIWQARRKCPGLVCVPSHHNVYREISVKVNKIYLDYTDLVDPFGIDESFLDVTGTLHLFGKSPKELADSIRERVRKEIGITISVGVSFCRAFAKLGSDYKKPDATTVFDRASMETVVWTLPVSDLLFSGKKMSEHFARWGIRTIGDLATRDRLDIVREFGEAGDQLWRYANGLDEEPVKSFFAPREVKSVGNGMTFKRDISGEDEIMAGVLTLTDEISTRLRKKNKKCTVVQVQIKDPSFNVRQKQMTLPGATWLQADLIDASMKLIRSSWSMSAPIRALTITAVSLVDPDAPVGQISLFDEPTDTESSRKRSDLENVIADIREKWGHGSIVRGAFDGKEIGISNLRSEKKEKKVEYDDEKW